MLIKRFNRNNLIESIELIESRALIGSIDSLQYSRKEYFGTNSKYILCALSLGIGGICAKSFFFAQLREKCVREL